MPQPINEPVSVALWSNHTSHKIMPYSLYWRGRQYRIKTLGLHHTVREGRRLFHIFSVSDGVTFFRLVCDSETFSWKLIEVDGRLD